MKILIIEDDYSNLKLLAEIVRHYGYEVLAVADARTGISVARKEQPDLILMDIRLRGMDGLTATEMLKSDNRTSHIKIVAVTSCVMDGDRERILESGCDDYLAKPIQYKTLIETIRRNLD